jgi:hypothetical protein
VAEPEPSAPDWKTVGVGGALLSRYQQDQQALVEQLATFLESTLAHQIQVQRTHGLIGPKHTTRLSVELNGLRYALERGRGDAFEASRTRVVRGVALRTDPLPIDAWLRELGLAIEAELERTNNGRAALSKLLEG